MVVFLVDLGEAFSGAGSAGPLCFGPGLVVATVDGLEGTEEAGFAGLTALGLVTVAPVNGLGFEAAFLLVPSLAALSSSFLGEAVFLRDEPGLETWFSAGPVGVLLPLLSALDVAPPPGFAAAAVEVVLTLALSLTLALLVGLLGFVASVFRAGFVSGDLVTTLVWAFSFWPGRACPLLGGLPELFSGEALPDVDGVEVV